MSYNSIIYIANMDTLASRRNDLSKNSFAISHNPPLASIVFFLPRENNLLFHALGHLQNTPEFTTVQSATALSLIMPPTTIRIELIKHLTNSPQNAYIHHSYNVTISYLSILIRHCSPIPIDSKHLSISICIYFVVYALYFCITISCDYVSKDF